MDYFTSESGNFHYRVGNETRDAEENELVFCPPGYSFKCKAADEKSQFQIGA